MHPKEHLKTIAIIPAAGLGTRVSHLTQGGSKEMLTFEGKTLIERAISEAIAAEIETIVVISRQGKDDLNAYLATQDVRIVYQDEPLGLSEALSHARPHLPKSKYTGNIIGRVAIILPDEVFPDSNPTKQLLKLDKFVLGTKVVPKEDIRHYGIVRTSSHSKVLNIVEKPSEYSEIFSTKAIIGRYILPSHIIQHLSEIWNKTDKGPDLTAVLRHYSFIYKLYAEEVSGTRVDMGRPIHQPQIPGTINT